jgi:WhiB family redox-sensing transcriptional regulator
MATQIMRTGRMYTDATEDFESDRESWLDEAACLGHDLQKFFPASVKDFDAAKKVCKPCDVRLKCLAWALSVEPPGSRRHGVIGGLTPGERDKLYKKLYPPKKENDND